MTKEEVIKLARDHERPFNQEKSFSNSSLISFANACEKIGMEKAAKICDEWKREYAIPQCCDEELASAIEEISHKIRKAIQ